MRVAGKSGCPRIQVGACIQLTPVTTLYQWQYTRQAHRTAPYVYARKHAGFHTSASSVSGDFGRGVSIWTAVTIQIHEWVQCTQRQTPESDDSGLVPNSMSSTCPGRPMYRLFLPTAAELTIYVWQAMYYQSAHQDFVPVCAWGKFLNHCCKAWKEQRFDVRIV